MNIEIVNNDILMLSQSDKHSVKNIFLKYCNNQDQRNIICSYISNDIDKINMLQQNTINNILQTICKRLKDLCKEKEPQHRLVIEKQIEECTILEKAICLFQDIANIDDFIMCVQDTKHMLITALDNPFIIKGWFIDNTPCFFYNVEWASEFSWDDENEGSI